MRIGFFTDNYLPSRDGIAISVETFRAELEKMVHEVYIIAPSPSLRYKEESDKIIRFPAFKGLFYEDYLTSLFLPPVAMKRIDELNLDIVHYHTLGQVGFLGAYYAMKRKLPLISTYHTDYYEYVKHYKKTLPGVIALSLIAPTITGGGLSDYRSALLHIKPEKSIDDWNQKIVEKGVTTLNNACDLVIAPSEKIRKQLNGWNTSCPIEVIPTGVDEIPASKNQIEKWREKLKLDKDTKLIAFVGRLGTEKNLSLLVKSFEIIRERLPGTKLLVIGGSGSQTEDAEGNKQNDVDNFKKQEGIIFTGYVAHNELGALYRLSTVFAFPSLTDTQGLVINEAALSGLPIVMIDKDITLVVKNGVNGFISKNNHIDMADKLLQILESEDLIKRMGEQSKLIAKQYSEKNQAKIVLGLYEKLKEKYDHRIVL